MNEWTFPNSKDKSSQWPEGERILCVDKQGWIVIATKTEFGFELGDGEEWGLCPIAWQPLPAPPETK